MLPICRLNAIFRGYVLSVGSAYCCVLNKGCRLDRLKRISIFNMPRAGKEVVITLKDECNILVLTGFNGVGKSRILSAIVEALSLARDVNYSDGTENWAMELSFDGGYAFRGVKIDTGDRARKKGYEANVQKLMGVKQTLKDMYEKVLKATVSVRDIGAYSSKSNDDDLGTFCALFLNAPLGSSPKDILESVRVVGFINEKVCFGIKRPEDDAVFDKDAVEGDLNKTLYVMIKEFVSTQAVMAGVEEEIERYVAEYLSVKKKGNKLDRDDLVAVNSFVRAKMKNRKVVEEDSNIFSQHKMFLEINKIFALTSRKLVYVKGSLCVELHNGQLVSWPSLSRGEKTLLALFLIVFLSHENALFVLDEPDLSLHIEWQRMILPGLLALAPGCQFIVATHSPALIMNTESEQIVNLAKLVSEAV